MTPKLKSKIFISLLPTILKLKSEGFTAQQVVDILAEKHNLEITTKVLSLYLTRFRNKAEEIINVKKDSSSLINNNVNTEVKKFQNEISTNEAFNGREYQFGTPEHKARVQAETEASFKSNQKIGLRNRWIWDIHEW